jgi:hypothetical protein
MNRRLRWAWLVLLVPALALAQTAPMPDLSIFAPHDRWEWRQSDNRTKLEEDRLKRTIVEPGGTRETVFSDDLSHPLAYMFVGEPSSKPWREWPLEVGRQRAIDVDWRRPDGSLANTRQRARVAAYEEVRVPACAFMAFLIELDGCMQTPASGGRKVETYWYAPQARANVRHVRRVGNSDSTRELVAYRLANP